MDFFFSFVSISSLFTHNGSDPNLAFKAVINGDGKNMDIAHPQTLAKFLELNTKNP